MMSLTTVAICHTFAILSRRDVDTPRCQSRRRHLSRLPLITLPSPPHAEDGLLLSTSRHEYLLEDACHDDDTTRRLRLSVYSAITPMSTMTPYANHTMPRHDARRRLRYALRHHYPPLLLILLTHMRDDIARCARRAVRKMLRKRVDARRAIYRVMRMRRARKSAIFSMFARCKTAPDDPARDSAKRNMFDTR